MENCKEMKSTFIGIFLPPLTLHFSCSLFFALFFSLSPSFPFTLSLCIYFSICPSPSPFLPPSSLSPPSLSFSLPFSLSYSSFKILFPLPNITHTLIVMYIKSDSNMKAIYLPARNSIQPPSLFWSHNKRGRKYGKGEIWKTQGDTSDKLKYGKCDIFQ